MNSILAKMCKEKNIYLIGHSRKIKSHHHNRDKLHLRILTGKTHHLIKLQRLQKSTNMGIWVVGTSHQLFVRVLKLKQNFQKNKVVTGKTQFFVIRQMSTHHSICLNIGF